jgi:hypothetical protein
VSSLNARSRAQAEPGPSRRPANQQPPARAPPRPQLWDVSRLVPAGTVGAHAAPLTSLSADGALLGSTCAGELRLWELDEPAARRAADAAAAAVASGGAAAASAAAAADNGSGAAGAGSAGVEAPAAAAPPRQRAEQLREQRLVEAARAPAGRCISAVPIGLPVPSPALEPRVAVDGAARLAALSNCSAPAPSSVVRIYCARPPTAGALLRELPVNAAADMAFADGRLLVAAAFHGRSLGGPERAFTVVVHAWDTDTWAWSRLVSPRWGLALGRGRGERQPGTRAGRACPRHGKKRAQSGPALTSCVCHPPLASCSPLGRPALSGAAFAPSPSHRLSTPFPITSGQGLPLIHVTQDWLLCATPARAAASPIPTCAVNAWRLPPRAPAPAPRPGPGPDKAMRLRAATAAGGGASSPSSAAVGSPPSPSPASAAAAGGGAAAPAAHDPYLTGRPAPVGPGGRPPVLLVVGDTEGFDPWLPVLAETGPGRLSALTSTPGALLMASPEGQVRAAVIGGAMPRGGPAGCGAAAVAAAR